MLNAVVAMGSQAGSARMPFLPGQVTAHPDGGAGTRAAGELARFALRSLHAELVLYPKPGLVSLHDNGSHEDMDAGTFVRSLFSLRRYFFDIAVAGMEGAAFARLRDLGIAAEARMLRATGGVNTHRGAVFALGLLAAAAGSLHAQGRWPHDEAWRGELVRRWGRDLRLAEAPAEISHGMQAAARYRAGGARAQALAGFPAVFETGLPALRSALQAGATAQAARLHAFFHLLASLEDTNLLYRGGPEGLAWMRESAAGFVADGGVLAAGWRARAGRLHWECYTRRLSPGGSADMLAATCLVHAWQDGPGALP